MSEERLKEIKNNINFNLCFKLKKAIIEKYYESIIDEELELYNEVIRLREIIDKAIKEINYWGVDKEHNDNSAMRYALNNLLDILGEDKC